MKCESTRMTIVSLYLVVTSLLFCADARFTPSSYAKFTRVLNPLEVLENARKTHLEKRSPNSHHANADLMNSLPNLQRVINLLVSNNAVDKPSSADTDIETHLVRNVIPETKQHRRVQRDEYNVAADVMKELTKKLNEAKKKPGRKSSTMKPRMKKVRKMNAQKFTSAPVRCNKKQGCLNKHVEGMDDSLRGNVFALAQQAIVKEDAKQLELILPLLQVAVGSKVGNNKKGKKMKASTTSDSSTASTKTWTEDDGQEWLDNWFKKKDSSSSGSKSDDSTETSTRKDTTGTHETTAKDSTGKDSTGTTGKDSTGKDTTVKETTAKESTTEKSGRS